MGIQINGQTDRISAVDGTRTFPGTVTYEDVSRVNVTGVSTFAANVHVSDSIAHLGDIDTSIRFPAADTFTVETAGSERLRITSAGLVGIGTDNPAAKLEVATSVDGEATLATFKNTSGGGTNETVDIKLGLENTVASNVILRAGKESNHGSGAAADNFFAIHTTLANTSSEKLRIHSSGEVTKALQPRFHADMYDGGTETDQTGYDGRDVSSHRIEYSNTQYDIGGNFTTSGPNKGLFTAPVEGLYLFHASASIQSGANWGQSWFIVNGSRVRGTDWVLATSSTIAMNSTQLYLSAGATVGFHPYNNASGNTISGSRYHTYLKGCLLA